VRQIENWSFVLKKVLRKLKKILSKQITQNQTALDLSSSMADKNYKAFHIFGQAETGYGCLF
jgi:hypothetical protein